ncbi:MAG: hypothetical protein CVV64_11045 [Candidatus Wallbacteria bacterium HGW-Wallbacteria-1]|jgi:hypothetical protein|uniref:DUF3783 domain-containing protein n=1 Tax=Candidatus Wallbacteria bacterium HGW-Wallbacteria-1 TaxID=2013854 RepID=A0A2N1PNY3_9BACT|nr:MAG: hypothetical protein CVV64_11045 [Candidatus Wallbacteria bacterium HGW-Wallbacteria-1]
MVNFAILTHNLNLIDSKRLLEHITVVSGKEIIFRSTCGKTEQTVSELINSPETTNNAESNQIKGSELISENSTEQSTENSTEQSTEQSTETVILLHGFKGGQISYLLSTMPGEIKALKPIFCTSTDQNLNWSFNELLIHLLEEREYWQSQPVKSTDEDVNHCSNDKNNSHQEV